MNQLKAGVVLSYAVLGLNTVVGLLYTPYMLRMMGQSEYGLYSLVASVIAYLTILDLGFGNAIVRYTAKFRAECRLEEQYEMFGMFLVIYSVIGLIAFGAGLALYFNVDALFDARMTAEDLQKARIMMLLLSFNLAVTFPFGLFGSIITAYENFIFQKVVQIVRIVLSTVTMIVLLKMGYRAIGLVVTTTVFNILSLLINYWYCLHRIRISVRFRRFDWPFLREISVYSFYILLNVVMDRIYWGTGQFILGAVAGTVAVAIYSVAITLQQMYMNFSTAVSSVFLPKVTAMVANKLPDRSISDLFIRTGRIQYMVLAFILTGFVLFGEPFIRLWAGNDYAESYGIALLFFIPLTIPLIQNLGISILQARNQMKFRSLLYVAIALCSLGLSIPLAKRYGAVGCAAGTAAALVAGQILAMNVYYYRRQAIDIPKFWREILKMSVVPAILGIAGYLVIRTRPLDSVGSMACAILVFSVVYIPLFWYTSVNADEKKLIGDMVKRAR